MNIFNWFKPSEKPMSLKEIGELNVASAQPKIAPPKVKAGQQATPSFFKTAKPSSAPLPNTDRRLATTDILGTRNQPDTWSVIREMVAASPDLSSAVFAYLRTAITPDYVAVAKNLDGTFNREATVALQQLIVRLNILQDYTDGFSGITGLRACSESLSKELIQYGAMSLELVLGKDRLPRSLVPISITKVKFRADDKWLKPFQLIGGVEVDLDIPTFFYSSLDQDLLNPYASSMLESAIQPVLFSTEFQNDLRRVVKKAIHPRLKAIIDSDKFKKNIPADVASDPDKLVLYMNAVISEIEGKVNGLQPEDALIVFDTLDVSYMTNGNISLDAEYTVLNEIIDAKLATGAKTLPSILGHGSGSQNIASSETLLFMKNSQGAVQGKLNDIYSRALTLALRLYGFDVYAEFTYGDIDLRPASELEAFKSMKQSRILDQLSLGLISDEEAGLAITGSLPPVGAPLLSGTFFRTTAGADPTANPYSGSATGTGDAGGGALNQSVKSDAPKNSKGSKPKANNEKA
ncbi:hypothetical protein [Methylotenera sp.]|uniref:hypothetical protein n=1 Tax=Methylotenera sp. TaxID=2051956 RepID=UPI0024872593|nr:hypothetical protein [Methylotenera sp.]MDI1362521.1 hypothetical protein [Methylotenera sp.]